MKRYIYYRHIPDTAELDPAQGLLLRSDDQLKDSTVSRASLQKILLSPVEDIGLEKQFQKTQIGLWGSQLQRCGAFETIIRLPDMLFDCLLPQTDREFCCIADMFQCSEHDLRLEADRLACEHCLCCSEAYHFPPQYLRLFELQIWSILKGAERCGRSQLTMVLPYSGNVQEIELLCSLIDGIAAEFNIICTLGIEVCTPKAAVDVQSYAGLMSFLVYDTEALTQKMYGVSDGAAADAIAYYMRMGAFEQSPFCSFDRTGLGTLLMLSMERARQHNHMIDIGLMGKPACEPVGLAFCQENGVRMLIEGKDISRDGKS